ncbi:MAG: BatD family protein [Ghiorsea sp.]|nr:BatD family protein [Ghiorsea sp.]
MVKWLTGLIFLLLLPHMAVAEVSASLNQSIVPYGESVRLTVTAKGDVDGEPNVAVLRDVFDILSQSQSSNFSMINGSISRSKTWDYNLMPKQDGMIQVPAIAVGNEKTQALMLRVLDNSQQSQSTDKVRDIWLEAELDKTQVYVQAQVVLTIKLIRSVNLSQAELSEPDIQGAVVERLGEDKNYEAVVSGRRVIVSERKYAIFPQHSGELTIPAIRFDGVISDSRSMFTQGRAKRVRSKPMTLHVLPKPASWDKHQLWMPAQAVELEEILPDGTLPEYKVGEPFTRTIELRAQGLTSAQLPSLLQGIDVTGFKLYPDQPELSQGKNSQGLVGVRREKVAMIPTHAGTLRLPEIRVTWWNTETKKVQSAVIAAREIEVLPTAQGSISQIPAIPSSVTSQQSQIQTVKPQAKPTTEQAKQQNQGLFWKWFALVFAALWLFTLFLWWRRSNKDVMKQQDKGDGAQKLKAVEKQLNVACKMGDTQQVLDILPKWGAAFYQDQSIQSLLQLKGKSDALDSMLQALQAARYAAKEESNWSCEGLMQALDDLKIAQSTHQRQASQLKSLYDK